MFFRYLFCLVVCVGWRCGIYSFRDGSIPPEVKTIKIEPLGNQAAIVNAGLANSITNRLKSKIQQQTKLTLQNQGAADYELSGYISRYEVSTSGIVGTQAAQNQLNLGIHISFTNNLEEKLPNVKSFETDISLAKQFSAQLTLQQAEALLLEELTEEAVNLLFNRIFSNW